MARPRGAPVLATLTILAAALAGCMAASPDADEGPAAASGGTGGTVEATMKNVAFQPKELTVSVGTTVTWVNEDPFMHTVTAWDGSFDSGEMQEGDTWSFTFDAPGTYPIYCKPHAAQQADGSWKGMIGTVVVTSGAAGAATQPEDPPAAQPVDVAEIGRDASDVPPPVGNRGPEHLTFDIESVEVTAEMADGTTFTYWTFDNTVPGPMLRVREGDTVTVNLHNDASSTMGHNIDFHAVTGPGGGAGILDAEPGETATLTFKTLNPGLYVYHCAFQDPPLHVAHGMYGLILVEPAGGLPPVDEEFYVMQGDFYSAFSADQEGHHDHDTERALAENPTFVVFNGRVGSLQDADRQLQAEVGDEVRMFVGNGGPNLVSSFHVIGEIFDRAWDQGGIGHAPQENIQTTLVPAGGAAMVEFGLEVPGDYFLVDHSIYRIHKGAFGVLHAEGEENPDVYRSGE